MRPPREYRPAKTFEFEASSDRSQSHISEDYVRVLRLQYRIPQDVHFYEPRHDEKADQPPAELIAINENTLDARLQFPLHPTIFHLLAACNQSITQIMPNCWRYILSTMTVLGQVGLYRMPTPGELNWLMAPITQSGGYDAIQLRIGRELVHGIPNKIEGWHRA